METFYASVRTYLEQIPVNQWLAILIWAIAVIGEYVWRHVNRTNISNALKGSDGEWDMNELITRYYYQILPILFFTAVALQLPIPTEVWAFVDLVGGVIILGKSYIEVQKLKKGL